MPYAIATTSARLLLGAFVFCGQVPEPDLRLVSRDDSGITHATLAAPDLRSREAGQPVGLWLVYPGFKTFPAAVGAFRREVTTPAGRLELCLVPDTETIEAPGATGAAPVKGALAYLSYDPSVAGAPSYPLDPAFEDAKKRNLLTALQRRQLEDLDRVLADRGRDLATRWNEFRQSPYVLESRRRLLDAVNGFYAAPPAFVDERALEPARFFDQSQREALRALGHSIPGHCFVDVRESSAVLDLRSCPLEQLANTWNRLVASGSVLAPAIRLAGGAGAREIASASFQVDHVRTEEASRLLFSIVTAFGGVEAERPPSPRR